METVDVVVVGSGVAGMTTALIASLHGLRVVILEKSALVGGATSYSSGGAFLPGCHHLPPEPDPSAPLTYLDHCMGGRMDRAMVETYLGTGPAALAALEKGTAVRFQPYGGVDYRMNAPGATTSPRTVLPVSFDARSLGRALKQLRPPLPTTTIFGGMQVDYQDISQLIQARRSPRAMLYAARLLLRHVSGRLRYGRSPRLVFGNALAGRLFQSIRDRDIEIRLEATVRDLIVEQGRVVGLLYRSGGADHEIRATRGVMLATGGFAGNAAMRAERAPFAQSHKSLPPPDNVGDGIAMAIRAGARLGEGNLSDYCLTPVSSTTRRGRELLFPHFAFDRCKPGAIAVGADGRRFVNEGAAYSDFVLAMYQARAVPAFLICDRRFLRTYGLGMVLPAPFPYRRFIRDGYLVEAPSIAALAAKLGIDPAGLADSVARNNAYAAAGEDPEFGKGDDPYSRSLGDPSHRPNPCLGPIEHGPFHAIRLYPGDTATTCGLVVDTSARVLDADDRPIPGLYASGPDMANPTMGSNPSGGCNIGPALTFGYIAANHMASGNSVSEQGRGSAPRPAKGLPLETSSSG